MERFRWSGVCSVPMNAVDDQFFELGALCTQPRDGMRDDIDCRVEDSQRDEAIRLYASKELLGSGLE